MAATIPLASSSSQIMTHVTELQQGMDKILTAAAELAGSRFTRDYRQHAIITQCGELKAKMNELLSVIGNTGDEVVDPQDRERVVGDAVTDIGVKVSELRREVSERIVKEKHEW